jgi:hypothetical protein
MRVVSALRPCLATPVFPKAVLIGKVIAVAHDQVIDIQPPESGRADGQAERRASSRALLAVISAILLISTSPELFDVALWDNGGHAAAAGETIARNSHPCGAIAILRVSAMPSYSGNAQAGYDTDLIVEAGLDDEERMRWSVPVDSHPLALQGDEILVDHAGQLLWIGASGSIRRGSPGQAYSPLAPMQCPARGAHSGSDYARCAAVLDAETERQRLIEFEGPCT